MERINDSIIRQRIEEFRPELQESLEERHVRRNGQYKSKPGMVDRLAERIKEAIPLISEVSGFMGYYANHGSECTITGPAVAVACHTTIKAEFYTTRRRRGPRQGALQF